MRRPHPELVGRLAADPTLGSGAVGRALVPGCGRGHDALALASAGWDVTAVDIADSLEPEVGSKLRSAGVRFLIADALAVTGSYQLVFDHTFFCALEPVDRHLFGGMVDSSLASGGIIASVVFPLGRPLSEGGPPYGMTADDVEAVLGPTFEPVEIGEPFMTGRRSWPHMWAVWRKR
jgi:methyl halide transferase